MKDTFLQHLLVVIFLGVLGVCLVGTTIRLCEDTSIEWDEKVEQRPFSTLPQWKSSNQAQRAYFSQIEGYLRDRILARNPLLLMQTKFNYLLGQSLNPDVIVVGKSGWLFYGDASDKNMSVYTGKLTMSEAMLNRREAYFTELCSLSMAHQSIPLILNIVPAKTLVYSEFIPIQYPKRGITIMDQILGQQLCLPQLNLLDTLLQEKEKTDLLLYYPHDSHWTKYGAYVSYRKVMDQIRFYLDVQPLVLSKEDFVVFSDAVTQDQQSKIGGGMLLKSQYPILVSFKPSPHIVRLIADELTEWKVSEKDTVNTIKDSYTWVKNKHKKHKILIFGDSFTVNWSDYFNESFGEIMYVHYFKKDDTSIAELISFFKPDLILFNTVSRMLNKLNYMAVEKEDKKIAWSTCQDQDISAFIESSFYSNMLETSSNGSNQWVVQTTGGDGYLVFPLKANWQETAAFKLSITLTSFERDHIQLFYNTNKENFFAEERSISKPLNIGTHTYEFLLQNQELNGEFRLDFGTRISKFNLKGIEICTSNSGEVNKE